MTKIKQITKVENANEERQIITGLIVDPAFARQIIPILKLEYFKSPFSKTVVGWCVNYWNEYEDVPLDTIEDIYKSKNKAGEIDETESGLISKFLESISDEYERTDKRPTEYVSNNTEAYFKKRALEILKQDITALLAAGDVEQVEEALNQFRIPEREIGGGWINPFTNEDAIREAYEHVNEPLFTLPGAAGQYLNELFTRGSFIGVMGPEKRGKTWMLMYLARRAAMCGNNVVHVMVGDMSEKQILVRHHTMNSRRSNKAKFCSGNRPVPILDCYWNQIGKCDKPERQGDGQVLTVTKDGKREKILRLPFEEAQWHIPCVECMRDKTQQKHYKGTHWWKPGVKTEPLDWREAVKQGKNFTSRNMPGKNFRLSCHSRGALNVSGLVKLLKKWEYDDGFIPDVIVIDYADNLGPEPGSREFRHQQNETWGALRSLSLDWDCCVITATQADAASYEVKTLKEINFSEDKRKYSHVTGFITLNQEHHEKLEGIMRLGKLFVREDELDKSELLTILQDLSSGQPLIGSYF